MINNSPIYLVHDKTLNLLETDNIFLIAALSAPLSKVILLLKLSI
jgi:hypothetical protein